MMMMMIVSHPRRKWMMRSSHRMPGYQQPFVPDHPIESIEQPTRSLQEKRVKIFKIHLFPLSFFLFLTVLGCRPIVLILVQQCSLQNEKRKLAIASHGFVDQGHCTRESNLFGGCQSIGCMMCPLHDGQCFLLVSRLLMKMCQSQTCLHFHKWQMQFVVNLENVIESFGNVGRDA